MPALRFKVSGIAVAKQERCRANRLKLSHNVLSHVYVRVAPVVEQPPLGGVDAPGVVGEDGLQGVGHPPVGGAQGQRSGRWRGAICGSAVVVMGGSPAAGLRGDSRSCKLRDNPCEGTSSIR